MWCVCVRCGMCEVWCVRHGTCMYVRRDVESARVMITV